MRVAIVGAGAAGLVTAWLVSERHDVAVYERAPIVGGNVRTLGGNVPWSSDERVDAGVIELERTRFPTVFRLLGRLGVQLVRVPGTTTLFPRSGPTLIAGDRVCAAGGWDQPRNQAAQGSG